MVEDFPSIQEIKRTINQTITNFQLPVLHPELRPYVDEDELHHPLLHLDGGVFPGLYNRINKLFAFKNGLFARHDSGYEWGKFYPDFPIYDRIRKFHKIELQRSDFPRQTPEYFRLLGDIWTDLELLGQTSNFLETFMGIDLHKCQSNNVQYMMTEAERAILTNLPDELVIYRGHYERLKHGISWTINPEVALQYALGTPLGNEVSVGTVSKTLVMAYIDRWDEGEIIVAPNLVNIIETIKLREGKVF